MKLKVKQTYKSQSGHFIMAGEIVDVHVLQGDFLLKSFPELFELVYSQGFREIKGANYLWLPNCPVNNDYTVNMSHSS